MSRVLDVSLPASLQAERERIEKLALDRGLDPFETVFCMVDYRQMNQIAAYGGFPTRYPHWRFGMEYDRLSKSYTFGMHRIYELVINNDPCYAYLLEANSELIQKLVIAHVFAHSDFFKHNKCYAETNRKMMDEMANHATQVRRFVDRHGLETVESFLDTCLSVENLIDPHGLFFTRPPVRGEETEVPEPGSGRLPSKGYMDSFVNPPEFLEEQARKAAEQEKEQARFPEHATKDILSFVLEHAPLQSWQQVVLEAVRDEAYYFVPQKQTKIMNEGWATFWHSQLMTEDILTDSEVLDYADVHAGTLATAPGQLNPYKLGVELFRDIEERWNKGRHGPEWEECQDHRQREEWDTGAGEGLAKVFQVRQLHSDLSFIDNFLTKDFCERHGLFTHEKDPRTGQSRISSREFAAIKSQLITSLTNSGEPEIFAVDGNFRNRGELYLKHRHEGQLLRQDHARDTLENLTKLWGRPVRLETVVDDKLVLLGHDGNETTQEDLAGSDYEI
ncbi:MAG: SpoVR family protein [Acidobacteriota bacterium]